MPDCCTVPQLLSVIGRQECPEIVDVTTDDDFQQDPRLIPCARRHVAQEVLTLVDDLRDRPVVMTCHKGLKLSQGAAALLRTRGVAAKYLVGGNVAWASAEAPRIKLSAFEDKTPLWVAGPHDLVATWIIRRFVSPDATILSVSNDVKDMVADRFSGVALPAGHELLRTLGLHYGPLNRVMASLDDVGQFSVTNLIAAATNPDSVLDAAFAAASEKVLA